MFVCAILKSSCTLWELFLVDFERHLCEARKDAAVKYCFEEVAGYASTQS